MINKTLNNNSANRVDKVEGFLSKSEKNSTLFRASQKIMEAGVEMMKISSKMSAILFEMGDQMLKEIDLRDDKMTDDDIQNIIDDILSIKKGL